MGVLAGLRCVGCEFWEDHPGHREASVLEGREVGCRWTGLSLNGLCPEMLF